MSSKAWLALSAFALLAVTPAEAQTSQCQWVGNVWTCNQQQRSGVDWGAALRAGQQQQGPDWQGIARQREENERERRRQIADQAAAQSQAFRAQVGQMVADGHCDEAKKAALARGDFQLAEQTVRLCDKSPDTGTAEP